MNAGGLIFPVKLPKCVNVRNYPSPNAPVTHTSVVLHAPLTNPTTPPNTPIVVILQQPRGTLGGTTLRLPPGSPIPRMPWATTGPGSGLKGPSAAATASRGGGRVGTGTNTGEPYFVRGDSGNAPTVKGGSSGSAGARRNPMDQLQSQMSGNGLATVAGDAGRAGIGLPRAAPVPRGPGAASAVVAAPPKGGSTGGWNGTVANSGNSPSKGTGAPPAGGGRVSAPPRASSGPVDYGGCAGCRKKPVDDLVVR